MTHTSAHTWLGIEIRHLAALQAVAEESGTNCGTCSTRRSGARVLDACPPPSCQRFRVLVSLSLDVELSRFELKLLGSHAVRCAACRAYAEEAEAITAHIRASESRMLDRPVTASGGSLWRSRSRPRARGALGVAALAMLLVVALGAGSSPGGHERMRSPATAATPEQPPDAEQALLRALGAPSRIPGRTKAL